MALPKIETPKYELTLPSSGKKISYRPFTVAEEKLLLIASESDDQTVILNAIRDLIAACTFGDELLTDLKIYDFEYLFLNIRAKSVGETVTLNLDCDADGCNGVGEIVVDLSSLECTKPEKVDPVYKIDDTVSIKLTELSFIDAIELSKKGADDLTGMVENIIEAVYSADEIFIFGDQSKAEKDQFINSLPHAALEYIEKFIGASPKIIHEAETTCGKCGKKQTYVFEGIMDFF